MSSDAYWSHLHLLCSLLAPFAEAIASVQSRAAGLADIIMHLLQLAKILEAAKAGSVAPAGKPYDYSLALSTKEYVMDLPVASCRAGCRYAHAHSMQSCCTDRVLFAQPFIEVLCCMSSFQGGIWWLQTLWPIVLMCSIRERQNWMASSAALPCCCNPTTS